MQENSVGAHIFTEKLETFTIFSNLTNHSAKSSGLVYLNNYIISNSLHVPISS